MSKKKYLLRKTIGFRLVTTSQTSQTSHHELFFSYYSYIVMGKQKVHFIMSRRKDISHDLREAMVLLINLRGVISK